MLSTNPRSRALLILLSLWATALSAQTQLGLRLERYAGIHSAALNPAFTAFNPQRWDLSLVSADLFLDNTYAFIRDASVPEILRNPDRIVAISDTSGERPLPPDALVLDYYNIERRMFGVVQARLGGPAFSFRIGENHTLGLQTALRSHVSTYRIPAVMRYAVSSDLPINIPVNIDPARVTAMAWGEIGLHYNYRQTDNQGRLVTFGVSPKLLLGLEGASLQSTAGLDYIQRGGDTASFSSARWDYALTLGNARKDAAEQVAPRINGWGGGIDLGVAISVLADDGDSDEDYQWRLGVSLLDLGAVRFNRDAQRHRIVFDSLHTVSRMDFTDGQYVDDHLANLSNAFLGDPAASLQANQFSVALPAALSLQVDYRIAPMFYAGAVLVQRIPLGQAGLRRPNLLAITPRFEHRWFSATLPVALHDYHALRVGFAARLAFLTVGTEHLGSFFGQQELTGTDFYIGLKINGFSFGGGNGKTGGGSSRGSRRKIKCYQF